MDFEISIPRHLTTGFHNPTIETMPKVAGSIINDPKIKYKDVEINLTEMQH